MAGRSLNGVLQHIRKVAAVHADRGLSDRELLERFIAAGDEGAFTLLIERHGSMVFGVCRRALANFHDAEDACQATFLVLARKAASVRKKTSLSSWLHGVARRMTLSLKRDHTRRKNRELGVEAKAPKDPAAEVTWRELQPCRSPMMNATASLGRTSLAANGWNGMFLLPYQLRVVSKNSFGFG